MFGQHDIPISDRLPRHEYEQGSGQYRVTCSELGCIVTILSVRYSAVKRPHLGINILLSNVRQLAIFSALPPLPFSISYRITSKLIVLSRFCVPVVLGVFSNSVALLQMSAEDTVIYFLLEQFP